MKLNRKVLIAIVSTALLLIFSVSGTVAYLVDASGPVDNVFKPAKVTVDIPEDFKNNVKENVKIQNTGNVKAYVRAMYIVTWQKDDVDNVKQILPASADDYELILNQKDWLKDSKGIYYWPTSLDAQAMTDPLIISCKVREGVQPPEEGYYLNVEIVAQAIQAEPTTAVTTAWKVTVDEKGTIKDVP